MRTVGNIGVNIRSHLKVDALKRLMYDAAYEAELAVAQKLLQDSKAFVPVLTGQLKDSAYVDAVPTMDDAIGVVRVIYNTPYALTQHEDPYWHPSLGFHGAARYLTRPLEMFSAYYTALYEYEFKRAMELKGDLR